MDALYELTDGGVVATEYTRGPWDPNHQHGGAPAALLVRAFETLDPDPTLALVRVTFELLRPVPLGELSVRAEILRPGRRVQLLEGVIAAGDGTEVLRARALRVRRGPVSSGGELSSDAAATAAASGALVAPPSWSTAQESPFPGQGVLFPGSGMEIRYVSGSFVDPGPGTAWFRLKVPVIAGEVPSPLQRLAAAADFPNGMSTELPWDQYVFINPDLTLSIEREPVGEWIALAAAMRTIAGQNAVAQAVLYDERGRVGRTLQSLYIAER